jgi:ribosomal protein S14
MTNRGHGVYSKFGLSRLMFRKYVWKGKLIGVKNSSW